MAEASKKRKDLSLQEKQSILESYDKLPKMSQRSAAVHLKISQPFLCKILKNKSDVETSALTNENTDRKRARSGKDSQVESALKILFSNVREKNALIYGPLMLQKAEPAKTMGKEKFSATDGWFNRWKKRENIVYKRMHGAEKSADFLAADEWIKREWPKIIAEYSPEDTYNAEETGLYFRVMPEHTICLKMKVLKDLNLRKSK